MPSSSMPRTLTALALLVACGTSLPALAQTPESERLDDFFASGAAAPLALDLGEQADDAPLPDAPELEAAAGEDFAAEIATETGAAPSAPEAALPPGPAATPLIVAAPIVPEGWQRHEQFGLGFALPANFELLDLDISDGLSATYQAQDGSGDAGAVVIIGFQPQSEVDDMLRGFGQELGVDFEIAPEPRVLGPLSLTDRRGSAVVPPGEGAPPGPASLRILTGDVPTDWGHVPVIGLIAFNLDPSVTEEIAAGLIGSLGVAGDPALIGAPPPETFLDGLIRFRMPPDASGSGVGEEEYWISFRDSGTRQVHARVIVQRQPARDWLGESILQDFNGPVDVRAGVFAGQQVWVVHGRPAFMLSAMRTAPGDEWRRTSYVMQTCAPDRGPAVLSAVTTAERIAAGLTPEAMLAGFELIPPSDAVPCPAPIMATFAAAATDPAMVFDPAPPPRAPVVLVARTQFGLTLDLPEGFRTEDYDNDPEGGIGIAFRDPGLVASSFGGSSLRGSLVTLRFEPPEVRDAERARTTAQIGTPPVRQPEPVDLLGMRFEDWRGAAMVMADVNLSYRVLTHDEAEATGWVPVIGFAHVNESPAAAAEFERDVLASLRPAVPGQAIGTPDPGVEALQPPAPPPAEPPAEPPVVAEPPAQPPAQPPVAAKPPAQPPVAAPPPASPEAAAWAEALATGDASAVIAYLERWPLGAQATEARDWLNSRAIMPPPTPDDGTNDGTDDRDEDSADWQRALATGDAGAVIAYLERWPQGAHATEARDWLNSRAIMVPAPSAPDAFPVAPSSPAPSKRRSS